MSRFNAGAMFIYTVCLILLSSHASAKIDNVWTNRWSEYQLGGLFHPNENDDNHACMPAIDANWEPETVDWNLPCMTMLAYFAKCSLDLSPTQVLSFPYLLDTVQTNASFQQHCYCDPLYWNYSKCCNSCLSAHGYPSSQAGHIPEEYIEAQRSAYCSQTDSLPLNKFLMTWHPESEIGEIVPAWMEATPSQTVAHAYCKGMETISPTFPTATSNVSRSAFVPKATGAEAKSVTSSMAWKTGITWELMIVVFACFVVVA